MFDCILAIFFRTEYSKR